MARDLKFSTGFRKALLDAGSFKTVVASCVIKAFSGTPPLSADAALSGNTLLCTYTANGDGTTALSWEAAATGGELPKSSSETWEGDGLATGTPTFFRMETLADAGGNSTTAVRIQGLCGLAGSDLNMSILSIAIGAPQVIDFGAVAMPAQ